MTENQRLLLKQILVNPAEDILRLMYADELQEQGEEERAEFIRVQVELSRVVPSRVVYEDIRVDDYRLPRDMPVDKVVRDIIWPEEYHELRRRERELWVAIRNDMLDELLPAINQLGIESRSASGVGSGNLRCAVVSRGFISHITCTAEDWLKHADKLVWDEEMTDECGACNGNLLVSRGQGKGPGGQAIMLDDCPTCKATGRIPRPMPDTAQPIEKVVLTTLPSIPWRNCKRLPGELFEPGLTEKLLERQWPGIEFELPQNTGNFPNPDDVQMGVDYGSGSDFTATMQAPHP